MPYSIQTDDDITIDDIPDDIAPDAPQLKQRVQQVRLQRRRDTPEYKAQQQVDYEASQARLLKQVVDEMPAWQRPFAQLGAGYQNLVQGQNQLLSKIPGLERLAPTDEQIREKRRIDDALKGEGLFNRITGGINEMIGEAGPTMVGGISAVPQALAARLGPRLTTIIGGSIGGAAGSQLSPTTSDESRGANAAQAAVLGAGIPLGGQLVGGTAREGYKLLNKSQATKRAAEAVSEYFPEEGMQGFLQYLGKRIDDAPQPITRKGERAAVPTSAVQTSGSEELAQAEAFSRARPSSGPQWNRWDADRNAAIYDRLQDLIPGSRALERLERMRASATGRARVESLEEAARRGLTPTDTLAHVDTVMSGPKGGGANPGVSTVMSYVERVLGPDARGGFSPERLYEVRKTLADKLGGPVLPADELGAAAKGARVETMALIKQIDDALDAFSGGRWRPEYMDEFARRSQAITSGHAMRDVGETMAAKPFRGTTPEVTYHGLQGALKATEGKFGSKLTPGDEDALTALSEHLRSAEAPARSRKIAGTMGGGSQTNLDTQLGHLGSRILEGLPWIGGYVGRLKNYNMDLVEREMARLLQNPPDLLAALSKLPANRQRQLLEEAMRASQAAGGAAAGAASVQP